MIIDIKVPQLSESVAEANLLAWHRQIGEGVARGDNLVDIETDKVVLELPAPKAGVLVEILKGAGARVLAGEKIARIDTEAAATFVSKAGAAAREEEISKSLPETSQGDFSRMPMPSARKILDEKGLDPADVAGTGRGG
ncbi:MAG: E3 binding domain-containing protein, partial [Candidatus Accumulibacter sp.]|nr:E3 binding domain-containing protein [Accumulibacter sp.]